MAIIKIYDVCSDYSCKYKETITFYGVSHLLSYLKQEYGVHATRQIPGANPDRINWYCMDEYGDLFLQVHEN